jgi:plastocyanin
VTLTRLLVLVGVLGTGCALALTTPALLSAGPEAVTVRVTMTDYKFRLSQAKVPRGLVTFRVVNRGDTAHDFKIAGKKTPIYAPGKGGTLRVRFRRAGRFPFICAVPGHTALGMKGVLRVT